MSSSSDANRYDEIPYEGLAVCRSHPAHLAALAALFGHASPDVRTARILEIGCAGGANLLPMAEQLPQAELRGIDYSRRQVDNARQAVDELGLTNITFSHVDIRSLDVSWGLFDYIICHGVFSWVPRHIQDCLFGFLQSNLSEGGVAYVSYNTYPGWRLRGVVREMMHYHVQEISNSQKQIEQSRALLEFLEKSSHSDSSAYRKLLAEEAEVLRDHSDHYLFHEHLETVNDPCYFWQFVERAKAFQLQYLADAQFGTMLPHGLDDEATALLSELPLIRLEQYLDFLRNRTFRSTLLVRQQVRLERDINPRWIEPLHVALTRRTNRETLGGTAAALELLDRHFPESRRVSELLGDATSTHVRSNARTRDQRSLVPELLSLYASEVVTFRSLPLPLTSVVSQRPQASGLARWEAASGRPITSRRHEPVATEVLIRRLLPLLDGTRDLATLASEIDLWCRDGVLNVSRDGRPIDAMENTMSQQILEHALRSCAESGLLIA